MSEEKQICRPENPQDGPKDAVQVKVECIRTDFMENPDGEGVVFQQREKSEAHISVSHEIGILSIRDMQSNVMLTVNIRDAMYAMLMAINAAKEAGTYTE